MADLGFYVLPKGQNKLGEKTQQGNTILQGFEWGLTPSIKMMRIIGIHFSSKLDSWTRLFCCSASFFIVSSIHLWLVLSISLNFDSVSQSYYTNEMASTALSFNFLIDYLNCAVYVIAGHIFLILLAQPRKWKIITDSFTTLERNLIVPPDNFYIDLKRWSIYFAIYIGISVLIRLTGYVFLIIDQVNCYFFLLFL